jgi:hypothetical protein
MTQNQARCRRDDAAILAVQIGQRHPVNIFGASEGAVPILATEGEAAIRDEIGRKNPRLPAIRTVASTEL